MTFSESSRLLETAGYLFLGGGESVVEGRVLKGSSSALHLLVFMYISQS